MTDRLKGERFGMEELPEWFIQQAVRETSSQAWWNRYGTKVMDLLSVSMVVTCPECELPVRSGEPFLMDSDEVFHAECLNERDEREHDGR